jgi:hypothetical protein
LAAGQVEERSLGTCLRRTGWQEPKSFQEVFSRDLPFSQWLEKMIPKRRRPSDADRRFGDLGIGFPLRVGPGGIDDFAADHRE